MNVSVNELLPRVWPGDPPRCPPFNQTLYYRLASLLNVALCDTLQGWVIEAIQVRIPGILICQYGT